MSTRKIVALLPMKAHSARVPGKNFKKFAGKPLFQWVLDSLLEVKGLDHIVINTDARTILESKGLEEGKKVLIRDRKQELCGDLISMNDILKDDIQAVPADLYLMTHTTNPLLSTKTMEKAIKIFDEATGSDSLFTVNKVQARFYREDMSPVNHDPKNLIRTQDLEPWYEENSCLFLFTAESLLSTGARIGKTPIMMVTPKLESVDIDEPEDWIIAEALAKA